MTKLSTILKNHADDIRLSTPEAVAVEHLKQAGLDETQARLQVAQHVMEKEAASALAMKGIDPEEAVKLVKAANVNVAELTNFTLPSFDNPTVDLLKQAADYVDALEAQIAGLNLEIEKQASSFEAKISSIENPVQLPEQITKIASSAKFTKEDLARLQEVPQNILEKMANAMEEPWGMGNGVGYARPKTDPLLEFLVG